MKRILVGVDGSKESRVAANFAAEIAGAIGAQLVIVSAVPALAAIEGAPELIPRAVEWEKKEREAAVALVKDIAGTIRKGIVVETMVVTGAAAVMLADQALAGDVEMVVVGHRGRNAVARALLGSVADRLVQISSKPVLIVR